MLRLFETGQLAEDRIVKELEGIGITVTSRQDRVEILPHFSGSIDGIGVGFAESKGPHILEFKTHNAKSFALLDKGVNEAKPQHYIQMQAYMGGLKIDRAYYIAVNKDTDELYAERVKYDHQVYLDIKTKADQIISATEPPARIEENPARFACKFCDYKNICHGSEVPELNCRTCSAGVFCSEGFYCSRHSGLVPVEFQREGCLDYTMIQ
jgi:predicted phage-related endonuclease